MRPISISDASVLYDGVPACEIVRHWVDHQGLAAFSNSLRSFSNSLEDCDGDEYWQRALGPIRRVAFALCSTPLPFAEVGQAIPIDWKKIDRLASQCENLYPDKHAAFRGLVDGIEQLLAEPASPLIAPLENLSQQDRSLSVVLRDSRLNDVVTRFFSAHSRLRAARILSPLQLRHARQCDLLVPIGPWARVSNTPWNSHAAREVWSSVAGLPTIQSRIGCSPLSGQF